MNSGYVDTNLFVHAISHDAHTDECTQFLGALEQGTIQARLEPIVLHELSYALPCFAKHLSREDVARYLLSILDWPGILCNKPICADTVNRWRQTPGLGFADAYLAALASRDDAPVFTKNVRELRGQGVLVPDPLTGTEPA
jgi:predicted nucleic acid-binding protein